MHLDDESTWPTELVQFLDHHRMLFDDWHGPTSEVRVREVSSGSHFDGHRFPAKAYDSAIYKLEQLLHSHTLERGYHCTRLTDAEVEQIRETGMQPQNSRSLRARIESLVPAGLITVSAAAAFSGRNGADEPNRAGMIWFCFFPPHLAGESGIERFFRCWGGEALYNWHEGDASRSAILQKLGTPRIIVVDLPIANLNHTLNLATKLIRRYFINRNGDIREDVRHQDYTRSSIPPDAVQRVVTFPDSEFFSLTQCDSWELPL